MYNNDTVIDLHNNATMKQYNDNKKKGFSTSSYH